MIKPDAELIAQVVLLNAGFEKPSQLAKKIIQSFEIAQEQVSHLPHYDFGLRSMRQVLDQCLTLKLKALRIVNDQQSKLEMAEAKITEALNAFRPVHHKRAAEEKKRQEEKELRKNLPAGNLMARLMQVRKKKKNTSLA
jgi:hypothetical protein